MEKRLNLKALRVKLGLTQAGMAKKFGVCLTTYMLIENGKIDGKLSFWQAIQQDQNLTGDELCELQKKQQIQES